MKNLLILVLLLLLVGCGSREPQRTETRYFRYYKICLDGVFYWSESRKLAVAMNPDGTVQQCVESIK